MNRRLIFRLRLFAAILITSTGVLRVASLWFRELTQEAVLSLVVGAVYLIIGIGLFGRSRFALFMAILVPAVTSALALSHLAATDLHPLQWAGIVADTLSVACCGCVLWQLRNEPSA